MTSGISDPLCDALKSFASTESRIVMLGAFSNPATVQELLQLRRQLVADFGRVRVALEMEPTLSADLDGMTQAMRLLAAFRSRNAINQADWPVIRVRDHPQDYRSAIAPLAQASLAFWQWIERELGFRK